MDASSFRLAWIWANVNYPTEAEVAAVLGGVRELAKVFHGKLIIETDSSSVGQLLSKGCANQSPCFPLVADIRHNLKLFEKFDISVISRNRNRLAHELAAMSRTAGTQVLLARVPDNLAQLMYSECNPTRE